MHWHDEIEFIYVYEGSVNHIVNGEHFKVKKGQGLFINARQLHLIQTDYVDTRLYCLIFHPTILCSSEYVSRTYVSDILDNVSVPYLILDSNVEWQRNILDYIARIDTEINKKDNELRVVQNLFGIWSELHSNIKSCGNKLQIENHDLHIAKTMVQYVQKNYHNKITLQNICDAGGVGKTKGTQIFERYLHVTPVEYVNRYRIEKAAYLLRSTDCTMTEAACEAGFADSSYFAKTFRRYVGMSPKEYRLRYNI